MLEYANAGDLKDLKLLRGKFTEKEAHYIIK